MVFFRNVCTELKQRSSQRIPGHLSVRESPKPSPYFCQIDGKYQGVAAILASRLNLLKWKYENNGVWFLRGMKFHIFMSSPKHLLSLLERSWTFFVCGKIQHRKWLGGTHSIFRMQLRHLDELSASQKALVHFQSCGEQFTNDAKKYFGDVSALCPYCENAIDTRLHRFEDCVFFQPVRNEFPGLFKEWHCLPIQAKAYSLWPEPPLFENVCRTFARHPISKSWKS